MSENFISELRDCWERNGRDASERVARDEPAVLVKAIASLLPKHISVDQTFSIDAGEVVSQFRNAVRLLGNEAPRRLPKVIDHRRRMSLRPGVRKAIAEEFA